MLRNIDPFGGPAIMVNVGKTSNELAVLLGAGVSLGRFASGMYVNSLQNREPTR